MPVFIYTPIPEMSECDQKMYVLESVKSRSFSESQIPRLYLVEEVSSRPTDATDNSLRFCASLAVCFHGNWGTSFLETLVVLGMHQMF